MKIAFFLALTVSLPGLIFAQNGLEADPYPTYNPFAAEDDSPENSYPFYAPQAVYDHCSLDEEGEPVCRRRTFRYAYGPDRADEDGNSNLDLYYTDVWDADAAPDGKPMIVLLHGGLGSRGSASLSKRAVMFASRGYVAVVPDYTTFRDEKWNSDESVVDFPCLNEMEIKYILQQTLRDVRGVIRKTLSISGTFTAESVFPINPDQIFLFGVSHGAYTALQLATMDMGDFPTGDVTIADTEYSFAESLDDLPICPEEGFCQGVSIPAAYDLKGSIKGISLSTGATLSLDVIDAEDEAAMLFFHGTCDAAAPYWELSQKDAIARNITSSVPDFPEENLPCRGEEDGDYHVYGSQRIYDHLMATGSTDRPTGFISLCGARHNLGGRYGITGNDPEELEPGLLEYETLRFFAQLINGEAPASFRYALDHSLLPISDSDEETLNNHCSAVAHYGPAWPEAGTECPACEQDPALYETVIRIPFFDRYAADNERYLKIESVAAQIEGCPETNVDNELEDLSNTRIGLDNEDAPVTITQVFDFTGLLIPSNDEQPTLDYFLQSPPEGLPSGIYFIHLSNGKKKAYHIR